MRLDRDELEAAINAADRRDLIDPETLRSSLVGRAGRPGVGPLRATLDRRTFMLTDSQLERRFLPIARAAGLPPPLTQQWVTASGSTSVGQTSGWSWRPMGCATTRTPAQQACDRIRDQAHAAAGMVLLRFIRAQVRFEPEHVRATLAEVARRLRSR